MNNVSDDFLPYGKYKQQTRQSQMAGREWGGSSFTTWRSGCKQHALITSRHPEAAFAVGLAKHIIKLRRCLLRTLAHYEAECLL